jgi:hypothetical protein
VNSLKDLVDYEVSDEYSQLANAVLKRDVACLFCWSGRRIQAAHIFAQTDLSCPNGNPSLFERTGLKQKHQVQNGLLLCSVCHGEFDALEQYVDVADNKLVVKFVDHSNDWISDESGNWILIRFYKPNQDSDCCWFCHQPQAL